MRLLKSVLWNQAEKLTCRRGIGYEQRELYPQAIAAFTQAIEQGGETSAESLVHRGISRAELQDIEGAIADFESVIQEKQDAKDAYFVAQALCHKGRLHKEQGDPKAAWLDWTAAIDCGTTYAQPYYYRALLLIEKGEYKKALANLDAAIEAEPSMAIAYLQRGDLRHRLGNTSEAITDWQYAICNDFTLESAKQSLEKFQHNTFPAQLNQVLAEPLAERGLSVTVQYNHANNNGRCLDIYIKREPGTGVNYYTLPDVIRQHLVPLQLSEIRRFRVIGQVGEATRPDWEQSYDLYKGQPCPPSHWTAAVLAIFLFPPLAVPAFIEAVIVKRAYKQGNYIKALNASKLVNVFSIASSIPFCFFILLFIGYTGYDEASKQLSFSHNERLEHQQDVVGSTWVSDRTSHWDLDRKDDGPNGR